MSNKTLNRLRWNTTGWKPTAQSLGYDIGDYLEPSTHVMMTAEELNDLPDEIKDQIVMLFPEYGELHRIYILDLVAPLIAISIETRIVSRDITFGDYTQASRTVTERFENTIVVMRKDTRLMSLITFYKEETYS